MSLDAWHSQRKSDRAFIPSGGRLDYSKFDQLADSDDEEESREMMMQAQRSLPPALRHAMAAAQAAEAGGSVEAKKAAAAALERELAKAPPEFRSAMTQVAAERELVQSTQGGKGLETRLNSTQDVLEKQLSEIDRAQSLLTGADEDPSAMIQLLKSAGLSPDDVEQAQNAADPQKAMGELAKKMMERTLASATGGAWSRHF